MQTKRRGFFKRIGGIVGATLVGERVKTEPLPPYEKVFQENSLGPFTSPLAVSGTYTMTGVNNQNYGKVFHVSGLLNFPKNNYGIKR